MKVTKDHWLDGATKLPYPKGPAMDIRRGIVIHFTSGATAKSSVDFWRTPDAKGAEAHIIIDRDGTVYQVRPTNQEADHAGAKSSVWKDPSQNGKRYNPNRCMIGIELANGGDNPKLIKQWSKFPPFVGKHKNGGPVREWEVFPSEQLEALALVCEALVARYKLDDIVGHDDVDPTRKVDPGPAFPMQWLRERCGFKGLPDQR